MMVVTSCSQKLRNDVTENKLTLVWLTLIQNRRQKVFNRGALRFCGVVLRLCGGLDILKENKNSTDV